jgi:archaellum biogenesis ATPase FlaH
MFRTTTKAKLALPRTNEEKTERAVQSFLDMNAPTAIKFYPDHYICGSSYRSVWAVRDYPTETEEQAILRHLGEKSGVTLRVYSRHVTPQEERKIISNAASKNRMNRSNSEDLQKNVIAEANLQDVAAIVASMHRSREPLVHCAVYIEIMAVTLEKLRELQDDVSAELSRSKLGADRLLLRQQEGFQCVQPCGYNALGAQFERVMPASSAANLFPMNYSGKTDPNGMYIGRDKFGSNVIVDFDRRAEDKTNANILILGNSGEGKSYLMKLILTNWREMGKNISILDPDGEAVTLTRNLGGCYLDLTGGEHLINVLEPKVWEDNITESGTANSGAVLSRHISFLRDFFRSYKDFTDEQTDTLELLCAKLYEVFGMSDMTDFSAMSPEEFPILSDLYTLIEDELSHYDESGGKLYTKETLRELCLGLHSIAIGAESKFFNGHTNITDDSFLCFGVKGMLSASKNLKNALLFNLLAYMSDALLRKGNTVLSIDELHVFLGNTVAVEYIRNFMKRVRKRNSSVILASQNLSDFMLPGIAELTKPLFAIPTHSFLFNPGSIDAAPFMDILRIEESEYELIKYPQRGVCLFRCGSERFNLRVTAPPYKAALFGDEGGT